MIITRERLENFGACHSLARKFAKDHPHGLDISPLWGTDEEAQMFWAIVFASEWKRQIGWCISVGLIPARIRANLSEANLSEADLRGADLYRANLIGADLRGANLYRANLSEADLYRANLSEADLSEADLRGADLRGANLYRANLSEADLRWAKWNKHTFWPNGFEPERN